MNKTKPFDNLDGFTAIHNSFIDYIIPVVKPNTLKVILIVLRKTVGCVSTKTAYGWKEKAVISTSQFHKLTGIVGRTTLVDAVQDAIDGGYVVRVSKGNSFAYSINRDLTIEVPDDDDTEE